jgi:putative component of membrane protein insertase Oxa1/YidC/SpoIIIJ protein YidD
MKSSVTDLLGNTLEIAVNQTAIAAITGYQKYLSPRKGFSCAYRVLHNTDSCSQYIKKLIAKYGIIDAIPLARQRFKSCKNSSLILHSETQKKQRPCQNLISQKCQCKPEDILTGICDVSWCFITDCDGGSCSWF